MTTGVTRLAPSPTGALHLGNARTFLINWAIARESGQIIHMRIEDLDGPRVKPDAVRQTLDILAWLGLDWDGPPLLQSADLAPYRHAMHQLAARDLIYPCEATRSDIEAAASAPHAGDHEPRFPPDLRPPPDTPRTFDRDDTNYRFEAPDRVVVIDDRCAGRTEHNPAADVGDFVVWTKRAQPAYQLAVVVDDARQGVTEVVRGDDLLPSAARQMLLYDALDLHPPAWRHLPLVRGEDGRRLAKRHGDTRLTTYRQAGVPAERIIGLLASWSGAADARAPMTAEAFRTSFDPARLPPDDVVFTPKDHAWLLDSSD